jgi:hypothetical protein
MKARKVTAVELWRYAEQLLILAEAIYWRMSLVTSVFNAPEDDTELDTMIVELNDLLNRAPAIPDEFRDPEVLEAMKTWGEGGVPF